MSKAKGKGKAPDPALARPKVKGPPPAADTGPTASETKVRAIPPSSDPYAYRVKNGDVKSYAQFAVDFLKHHPGRPLTIHTPLDTPTSVQLAPRLITVVEMAKRALAILVLTRKATAHSIYQYNETGLLESEAEVLDLARVLSGKTRPKMTHRPFLRITLNTQPLDPVPPNATVQITPLRRPFARKPKAERRALARAIKAAAAADAESAEVSEPPAPAAAAAEVPAAAPAPVREAPPHVGVTPQEPKKKRKSNANDAGGSKRRRQ
ncbi:uncharacterized protein LOC62_07G009102 [Vanrija pseudolonga]|uniref:Uncharacterized protein n=1 Tax=Vanrija pseudolonga TaxID=143232 RepID=A0AAF1BLA3_9TREE|nr:hypothetical protein LOC62_07G009102 [Vanrija pseudolonga]